MNLDNIGVSTIKDSTAFKKIQFFSKTNPTNLFNVKSDFQNSFNKINNFYLTDLDLNNSYTYGMDRQHTYAPLASTLPNNNTLLDVSSVKKMFNYNFNTSMSDNNTNSLEINRLNYTPNSPFTSSDENLANLATKLLPSKFVTVNNPDFALFLKVPNIMSVISAENDSKQYANTFKFLLNFKHKKKNIHNFNFLLNNSLGSDLYINNTDPNNTFSSSIFNTENTLKFKDYKSSNAQFLGSERTVRLLNNLNSNSYK
jgi:hypothetical protein